MADRYLEGDPMSLTLTQKLKLVLEWSPAVQLAAAVAAAKPGQDRALAACTLIEWAARKSETPLDDDLTLLVKNILLTKEGGALIDYVAALIKGSAEQALHDSHRPGGV